MKHLDAKIEWMEMSRISFPYEQLEINFNSDKMALLGRLMQYIY